MAEILYPKSYRDKREAEQQFDKDTLQILIGIAGECADVADKWGARFAQEEHMAILRSRTFNLDSHLPEITFISDTRRGKQSVIVRAGDHEGIGFQKLEDPDTLHIPLPAGQVVHDSGFLVYVENKEAGVLAWDTNVGVSDLITVLGALNHAAEQQGLYDRSTKVRRPLQERKIVSSPKFKVDEVFSEIGLTVPILEDPQRELLRFDRPEELVIRQGGIMPFSPPFIAHSSDIDFLDRRDNVILEAISRRGLTPQEFALGLVEMPDVFYPLAVAVRREIDDKTENLVLAEKLRREITDDPLKEDLKPGLIALLEGDVEYGTEKLQIILSQYPENSIVYHDVGVAYTYIQEPESAYSLFSKATQLEPKRAHHFYDAGRLAVEMGQDHYREALDFFEMAEGLQDTKEYWEGLDEREAAMLSITIKKLKEICS